MLSALQPRLLLIFWLLLSLVPQLNPFLRLLLIFWCYFLQITTWTHHITMTSAWSPLQTMHRTWTPSLFFVLRSPDTRLIIKVMFLLGSCILHARAFIDPGSMGDFINSGFTTNYPFTLVDFLQPLSCTAFNCSPSMGGLLLRSGTVD